MQQAGPDVSPRGNFTLLAIVNTGVSEAAPCDCRLNVTTNKVPLFANKLGVYRDAHSLAADAFQLKPGSNQSAVPGL